MYNELNLQYSCSDMEESEEKNMSDLETEERESALEGDEEDDEEEDDEENGEDEDAEITDEDEVVDEGEDVSGQPDEKA